MKEGSFETPGGEIGGMSSFSFGDYVASGTGALVSDHQKAQTYLKEGDK